MQRVFSLIALVATSLATPAASAAQDFVDVLPVDAEVRFGILGSFERLAPGEVQTVDGCQYVRWTMGRDLILGVPLNEIIRMQIKASDVEGERALDAVGSSDDWVEVDVSTVRQSRPERCSDQPFAKTTPLHTGILIRP